MNFDLLISRSINSIQKSQRLLEAGEATPPGTSILFRADSEIPPGVTLEGFFDPENSGRWSDGNTASISFILKQSQFPNSEASIVLRTYPLLCGNYVPQVTLISQGCHSVINFGTDNSGPYSTTLIIPLDPNYDLQRVTVVFYIANSVSPRALGINNDERRLAFVLAEMKVMALDPKPQAEGTAVANILRSLQGQAFFTRKESTEKNAHLEGLLTSVIQSQQELSRRVSLLEQHLIRQTKLLDELAHSFSSFRSPHEEVAPAEPFASISAKIDSTSLMLAQANRKTILPDGTEGSWIRSNFGYISCPREEAWVALTLLETGDVEPGTRSVLERILQPQDTFIDVGANLGIHTLAAAKRVGAQGRVVAIEPIGHIREHLTRTLELNGVSKRVEVHAVAAGSAFSTGTIHVGKVSGHSSLLSLGSASRTETVEIHTVDSLVTGQKVAAVKIDVEGFELEVLDGMKKLLAANPEMAIILEFAPSHLARSGKTAEDWDHFLQRIGFCAAAISESNGLCTRFSSFSELAEIESVNVVCAPERTISTLCEPAAMT